MKPILSLLIFLALVVPALAAPTITNTTPTSDPSDTVGALRNFTVLSSERVNIEFFINGTSVLYVTNRYSATYKNVSAGAQNAWNVTARVNNSAGEASYKWNWTVKTLPVVTQTSPSASVYDYDAVFARTFNASVNQSSSTIWKIDGVETQHNQTSINFINYTARTGDLIPGTHTVTAAVNNTNGTGNTITWTWYVPVSTLSNAYLSTNISTSNVTRALVSTNGTFNFSHLSSGNETWWNYTFPAAFNLSALGAANVANNTGAGGVTLNGNTVNITNTTTQGLNGTNIYHNFTANLRPPAAAGDYTITLKTHKNSTGTTFTMHVRNQSRPYYLLSNNTVFSYVSETFGDSSSTLSLSGKGSANLTYLAPNGTSSVNISVGWGATNATKVFSNRTGGQTTIYVETDPSVQDPVIVLSAETEQQSSNIPAALAAGGAIVSLVVLYRIVRRKR